MVMETDKPEGRFQEEPRSDILSNNSIRSKGGKGGKGGRGTHHYGAEYLKRYETS
jgi:hypothetical protein